MRLAIDQTWDGRPALSTERASLALAWTDRTLEITVDAPFHGDPAPDAPPGPTDRLWEHEVVELFLVGPDGPDRPYTELELGPHGHHLVLRLEGIRRPVATLRPLVFKAEIRGERWRGLAAIARSELPDPVVAYNAYAIHGVGPRRRYLAHAPVPGDAPDYHRLQHFPEWPPAADRRRG